MKTRRYFLWLVLAIIFISAAARHNGPLNALKQQYRLVRTDPLENAPPLVAFTTVVLGGFRGILADFLWLRLSILQDQGKYFELVQLADWITKLEPRFPEVWAFHAWNLAYNVSILFDQPHDRWRWVRSGIELLRDQGIPYNPGEAQLYRELGWLFQHKLGADYDEAHSFYKQSWAREMADLLGGPRADFAQGLNSPAGTSLGDRVQRLIRQYKLNPTVMLEVDRLYGPFDWRLPYAHAVYWAHRGRPYAEGFERVALMRMILQSQAAALRRGRLVTGHDGSAFALAPDISPLPTTLATFKQAIAEFPEVASFREAYPFLLSEAILISFVYGRENDARALFAELSQISNLSETREGFEAFLFHGYVESSSSLGGEPVRSALKNAALNSAYWQRLGERELALGYRRLFEFLWRYHSEHAHSTNVEHSPSMPSPQQIWDEAAREVETAPGIKPDHSDF